MSRPRQWDDYRWWDESGGHVAFWGNVLALGRRALLAVARWTVRRLEPEDDDPRR